MATTDTDLFRSLMGDDAKKYKITPGEYPGNGVLYPRFEAKTYKSRGVWKTSNPDLTVTMGKTGPEVEADGGTSLHDVPGWFNCKEFWIPEGTEYSDEIYIRKDKHKKTSPSGDVSGYHYQLEPRTRMMQVTFMGYLDNMARAAVVRQVELGYGKKETVETKKS
jgi:hypothetical protein